jgi:predicted amidohydrolase
MKLGIYQCAGTFLDSQKNLNLMEQVAQAASLQGADLLVFPELFLTGYNIGDDAEALAEPMDGNSAQRAAKIATKHQIALLYGYTERADGVLYNSAVFLGADGKQRANYRKSHLFGDEERRLFHPGEGMVTVTIAGLKVGILICYDVEFPELVRALVLQGVDVIAVPTALSTPYYEIPTTIVRSRAYENQVFVAYVDHIGVERDVTFIGLSGIVGPDGRDIVRAGEHEETLMVANIDPTCYDESHRLNTYIEDRRPELYGDIVNSEGL